MVITITLQVEDYIYRFYQMGAEQLNRSPESLMEQALFMYAGIVANDLIQGHDDPTGRYTN